MGIETGKELLVKGLEDELTGIGENETEHSIDPQESEHGYDSYEDEQLFTGSDDKNYDNLAKMDEGNLRLRTKDELNIQINELIEENEDMWRCKICGKRAIKRIVIRNHAERHIQGVSHACQICSKTFPNRPNLRDHISRIHSELFSCDICGKTGMNRLAYRSHKRKNHN